MTKNAGFYIVSLVGKVLINVDTVFNNFFGKTANSNYAYVITKDSYNKTLTLEDFNCREKGNK